MRGRRIRGSVLLAVAVLLATGLPRTATAATKATPGPAFLTLGFGRSQWVSADNCTQLPNTVTLGQVADELAARGLFGTGNVILNRTGDSARSCIGGSVLQTSWADIDQLRTSHGWAFESASASYPDVTTLTTSAQIQESCGTLPALQAHSLSAPWGLYAYPNNKWTTSVQTAIVSHCFDFGRTYVKFGRNLRARMAAPWLQQTNSLAGGKCNDTALSCYTMPVGGNTRYQSPVALGAWIAVKPDQWLDLQGYRFVTGSYGGTKYKWDCTAPGWQDHWTSNTELYCWNDYLSILDKIPAGTAIASPDMVARAWGRSVETGPATTSIDSGPAPDSASPNASFGFTASQPEATFECSLDGGTFQPCVSGTGLTGLADGSHAFSVRSTDYAFYVGPVTTDSWMVDTTAPDVTVVDGPPADSNETSATFDMASGDPSAVFTCSLDGAAAAPCAAGVTFDGLSDGGHSLQVRAVDPAGNVGTAPLYQWVVDTTAPVVTIWTGPADPTPDTTANFTFDGGEAGVTFECSLDGGPAADCASGDIYTDLVVGPHSFQVWATDGAGNTGTAAWLWNVTA